MSRTQVPISSVNVRIPRPSEDIQGDRARGRDGPFLGVSFPPSPRQFQRAERRRQPVQSSIPFIHSSVRPSILDAQHRRGGSQPVSSLSPVYSVVQPSLASQPSHLLCVAGQTKPLFLWAFQGPTGPRGRGRAIWRMGSRAVSTTKHTHKTNASSLNRVPWERSHERIVRARAWRRETP